MIDKIVDIIKVWFSEIMNFIGVIYMSMDKGFFIEV